MNMIQKILKLSQDKIGSANITRTYEGETSLNVVYFDKESKKNNTYVHYTEKLNGLFDLHLHTRKEENHETITHLVNVELEQIENELSKLQDLLPSFREAKESSTHNYTKRKFNNIYKHLLSQNAKGYELTWKFQNELFFELVHTPLKKPLRIVFHKNNKDVGPFHDIELFTIAGGHYQFKNEYQYNLNEYVDEILELQEILIEFAGKYQAN